MASPFTWRVSTDPLGQHGYDVGQWPTGVDITDARQFSIVECWYDQASAARRAVAFNSGVAAPAGWTPFSPGGLAAKPKHR